jgi:hypothetical protein
MRRVRTLSFLCVALVTSTEWGLACGDKFLVVGRGVRQARAFGVTRPASILIYANPKSALPAALEESRLDAHLRKAGHRVTSVENSRELQAALAGGGIDIVMTALSDMSALEPEVRAAASKPVLLPVIYNPTGQELTAAEKTYSCVLKAPSRNQDYVEVINEALKLRTSQAKAH